MIVLIGMLFAFFDVVNTNFQAKSTAFSTPKLLKTKDFSSLDHITEHRGSHHFVLSN